MARHDKISFLLLLLGQVVTLVFITWLQISPLWMFIPLLIAMHMGIALLIISKKRFKAQHHHIKPYYNRIYLMLALYLPIIAYKMLGRILPYEADQTWITWLTWGVTTTCVIGFILNTLALHRYVRR